MARAVNFFNSSSNSNQKTTSSSVHNAYKQNLQTNSNNFVGPTKPTTTSSSTTTPTNRTTGYMPTSNTTTKNTATTTTNRTSGYMPTTSSVSTSDTTPNLSTSTTNNTNNLKYYGGIDENTYKEVYRKAMNNIPLTNPENSNASEIYRRIQQQNKVGAYENEGAKNYYDDDYMKYIENRYNNVNDAYAQAQRLAVQQGVNRFNAQKDSLNQAYDNNLRQAYIQYMQSQQSLPQQLANQGITGGATETANMGLQTAYQNNLNDLNNQRQNALTDIDNQILDLQNTGDINIANNQLTSNQALIEAYQNYMANRQNQANTNWQQQYQVNRDNILDTRYADETAYNRNFAEQQYTDSRNDYQDSRNDIDWEHKYQQEQADLAKILELMDRGLTTQEIANKTGIPYEQIQAYAQRINRGIDLDNEGKNLANQATRKSLSSIGRSSGGGSSSSKSSSSSTSTKNYNGLTNAINNALRGKAGTDVIKGSESNIRINRDEITYEHYLDPIIATAFDAGYDTFQTKNYLKNLGIPESDIERVLNYYYE